MRVKSPLRLIAAILILLMVIYVGYMAVISIVTGEPIQFGFWSQTTKNGAKGVEDFVVVGTDKQGFLTDLILMCRYNSVDNSATMLQIPRDTKVENKRRDKKINSAYGSAGGIEALYDEIESVLGIRPQKYVVVSLKGFRELIDAIGGVQFNVPMRMYYADPYQDLVIDLQAGEQLLDGRHAEMFMRFRSGYKNGDVERNSVQKDFYNAVFNKLMSGETVLKAPKILGIVNKNIKTDFTGNDIVKYMGKIPKLKMENINILSLPGEGGYEGTTSYFLHDEEKTEELVNQYFKKVKSVENIHVNPVKNKFIKVKVVDASGINTEEADVLKVVKETLEEYGFTVIGEERTERIKDNSVLINHNAKDAAKEVAKVYPMVEIEKETQKYEADNRKKSADVTLIVGSDFSF